MATADDMHAHARDAVLSAQVNLTEAMEATNRWAQTNEDAVHVYGRLRDAKEIADDLAVAIYTPLSPHGTAGLSAAVGEHLAELRDVALVLEAWRDRSPTARDALYAVWNAHDGLATAHDTWAGTVKDASAARRLSAVEAHPQTTPANSTDLGAGL